MKQHHVYKMTLSKGQTVSDLTQFDRHHLIKSDIIHMTFGNLRCVVNSVAFN